MRRSTFLLLATSLGLAAALAYVGNGLHDERARNREQTGELSQLRARLAEAGQSRTVAEPPRLAASQPQPVEATPPAAAPVPVRVSKGESKIDDLAKTEAEARVLRGMQANQAASAKMLADPAFRAAMRTDAVAKIRAASPDLGSSLGLSPQQETRLIELLAEQELRMKENSAGSSPERLDHHQLFQRHDDELRALLGSRKMEAFREFRASAPERAQVQALRARLDANTALRADQASKLVTLMRQEREAYIASFAEIGAGGHLAEYPFTPFSSGDDAVEEIRFAEAQLGRTEAFLQRLQSQAATVLTGEQLRRFREIQQEQMASERRRLEWLRKKASGAD